MSLLNHPALHMAAGFVLMGCWAAFANRAHPMPAPLIAGLVQGLLSACITLGLKRLIETLVANLNGLAAHLVPPLAAFAVSVTLLGLIHTAVTTPEVLRTMLVPVAVATLYATLYTFRIQRQTR